MTSYKISILLSILPALMGGAIAQEESPSITHDACEFSRIGIIENGQVSVRVEIPVPDGGPFSLVSVAASCGCTKAGYSSKTLSPEDPFFLEVTIERSDPGKKVYSLALNLDRGGVRSTLPVRLELDARHPFTFVPAVISLEEYQADDGSVQIRPENFLIMQYHGEQWENASIVSPFLQFEVEQFLKGNEELSLPLKQI